jgi:hypothetical protein
LSSPDGIAKRWSIAKRLVGDSTVGAVCLRASSGVARLVDLGEIDYSYTRVIVTPK